MDLSKFECQARGMVTFNDGQVLVGRIIDYTSSWDNDDNGAYITIVPESGELKGEHVMCPEKEVVFAKYL